MSYKPLRTFHFGELRVSESEEPDTIILGAYDGQIRLTQDQAEALGELLRYTGFGDNIEWVEPPEPSDLSND